MFKLSQISITKVFYLVKLDPSTNLFFQGKYSFHKTDKLDTRSKTKALQPSKAGPKFKNTATKNTGTKDEPKVKNSYMSDLKILQFWSKDPHPGVRIWYVTGSRLDLI